MRSETSILGTADPELSPLALARLSWRALVERGETEQRWCITFRLACPDRERAARLVAYLDERRG
ncbi:MAG: hypothetical protein ACREOF_19545 [Gemmatimonadales bacterium]